MARSGYVNLIQPQDRRSLAAGDSRDVVQSRAQLAASGIGVTLIEAMLGLVAPCLPDDAVVVELGSGSGDALAAVARAIRIAGIGIDISTSATEYSARRFPDLTWVVANADRRLPVADGSVDLVLSLHARRNPAECARIMKPGGHLLVAVPAHDDLIELRAAVLGKAIDLPRVEALIAEHEPHFVVARRTTVRERRRLDGPTLTAILRVTYRGGRHSERERLEALTACEITLASELVVFRPTAVKVEPAARG